MTHSSYLVLVIIEFFELELCIDVQNEKFEGKGKLERSSFWEVSGRALNTTVSLPRH